MGDDTHLPCCSRCGAETTRADLRWNYRTWPYQRLCGACRELINTLGNDGQQDEKDDEQGEARLYCCETCVHAKFLGSRRHPYGSRWAREIAGWRCSHASPPDDGEVGLEYDCRSWTQRLP